ncbi:MAG: terminase family protein [Verrucomicrobiales bacterium]|nr:terminase family protein [Verrucomicrobiales bacterium]
MGTSQSDAYWKKIADDLGGSGGGYWEPPEDHPGAPDPESWKPLLNTTQEPIFHDPAMVVLAYGEKGSGKTVGLCHSDVRHLYENDNALCLVIVNYITAGSEGIWYDFEQFVLPVWRDGNRYPDWLDGEPHPRAGEYIDHGIGLQFTETKLDPLTKDRHLWIPNIHDGWSKLLLKSIPHSTQVEDRIKGPAPSRVHGEELTNCNGPEYYVYPSAQLNRRRGIRGPQQYVGSCNPKGPTNWVYTDIVDKAFNEDGTKNPDISVYHVPVVENLKNLPPDYIKRLYISIKDPYERRRLIDGEWVDRPETDAIFKEYFVPEIHVKGDPSRRLGLGPLKGFPIIVGHDPGPKNYSIHMEQRLPILDQTRPIIWSVFDELNYVGMHKPYKFVVTETIKRMEYWDKTFGPFLFIHVADEAAFNQRNKDGSFDSTLILQLSGGRIRLLPCPKGKESVPQRVQMIMDMLLEETMVVSAMCEQTQDMFRLLPIKPTKEGEYDAYQGLRPKKNPYLHPFDSMSYPIFKYTIIPSRLPNANAIKPVAYAAGSGGR